jgi:hypothetical protein
VIEHIYQASDLASKRRELMDAARAGFAQIRDTDGTGLVMVPQGRFELLRGLREQFSRYIALDAIFERPKEQRRVSDFGEFAWLWVFDEDDQLSFRHELMESLVHCLANDTIEPAERCVAEWRMTARALSSEKSRRILTSPGDDEGRFEEVTRPE